MGELDTDQEGKNKTIDDESVEKAVELIQGYDKDRDFFRITISTSAVPD